MFAIRYIAIEGPLGNVLCRSIFTTSFTRALLFSVDTLSGLLFVTLFFTVTGGAQAKRQEGLDCELRNIWEVIGRLLAIAIASCAIGGIPGAFFASLQTRGPKVCNSPEARRRQLRVWRCQDITIWVAGLAYMAFAINFIVLFFANVDTGNVREWLLSAGIGLVQDHLILPLSVVVLHSLLTMLLVSVVARGHGVKKQELVQRYRMEKQKLSPKESEASEEAVTESTSTGTGTDSIDIEAMAAQAGADKLERPPSPDECSVPIDLSLNTFNNSPLSAIGVGGVVDAERGTEGKRTRSSELEVAWTPPVPNASVPHAVPPRLLPPLQLPGAPVEAHHSPLRRAGLRLPPLPIPGAIVD
jgi:hypothetical protein